jgi:GAF domain-containing protein
MLCFDEARAPNEWELRLAEFGVPIAGIAVERERTSRALRENEQRLAAGLAAARRLQAVSTQMIQEGNVETLYEQILDAAVAIMQSDFASIQVLSPERGAEGELRLLRHRGSKPQAARFWEWVRPASESTCGVALRTGQRVVVSDVRACGLMAGSDDLETYRQTGSRAVQTTPLVSRGGQVLGMISTHWRRPHRPSQRDLRLLDVLARQAAELLERWRTEEALKEADRRTSSWRRWPTSCAAPWPRFAPAWNCCGWPATTGHWARKSAPRWRGRPGNWRGWWTTCSTFPASPAAKPSCAKSGWS